MRQFYKDWELILNQQPLADDLELDENLPVADEFNWADFLLIGFSHHTEIISNAKTLDA